MSGRTSTAGLPGSGPGPPTTGSSRRSPPASTDAVARLASSASRSSAPASSSIETSRADGNVGSSATYALPVLRTARIAAISRAPCSNSSATGSGPAPRAPRIAAAIRFASPFRSAYVSRSARVRTARQPACSPTCRSKRAPIDCSMASCSNSVKPVRAGAHTCWGVSGPLLKTPLGSGQCHPTETRCSSTKRRRPRGGGDIGRAAFDTFQGLWPRSTSAASTRSRSTATAP